MSALKVIVKQDRENIVQFLVRLSSIIAGIIVISGYINSLIQIIQNYVQTQFVSPSVLKDDNNSIDSKPIANLNEKDNFLISNANKMATTEFEFSIK